MFRAEGWVHCARLQCFSKRKGALLSLGPCPPRKSLAFKISYEKLEVREDCFLDSWDWEISWFCLMWTLTSQALIDLMYKLYLSEDGPEGATFDAALYKVLPTEPHFSCWGCSEHTYAASSISQAAGHFRQVGQGWDPTVFTTSAQKSFTPHDIDLIPLWWANWYV